MAFGKAIGAEALDLVETGLREFLFIAALYHAADEFLFKRMHRPDIAEGCHGAAQAIGLFRRELRGHDGQPHRLLLE